MKKAALTAFKSIKDLKGEKDIVANLIQFKNYLNSLCKEIAPKGLKNKFIFNCIFTHKIRTELELQNFYKANLFAACFSLDRIIKKLSDEQIDDTKRKLLIDFICDLKPIITYFDNEQDYSWLGGNTNSHISNFYFSLAKGIFWNGKPNINKEEMAVLSSSTPFIIRGAIELKIKRVLGIDYILVNKIPYIKTLDLCFKILKENIGFFNLKNFDLDIIIKICRWTNVYIHGGYRPEPWKTETALNYLEYFFRKGETSNPNSYSWYSSIELKKCNAEQLKEAIEKSIKEHVGEDVKINYVSGLEVAYI